MVLGWQRRAPGRLALAALALAALGTVSAGAEAAAVLFEDFSTDPATSPGWTMHRAAPAFGALEWNPGHDALALVQPDIRGGPFGGAAQSTVALPSRTWNLHYDARWTRDVGAADGGLVTIFHRTFAGYSGAASTCDFGFHRSIGSSTVAGLEGYGLEWAVVPACWGGLGHSGPAAPHWGVLEDDLTNHHASAPAADPFDATWHAVSICFDEGRVRAFLDRALVLDHTIAPMDWSHDGWGFSASTDSYVHIEVDNVLLEDRSDMPGDACWTRGTCDPTGVSPGCLMPCGPHLRQPCEEACGDTDGCGGEEASRCPRLGLDPPVQGWVARAGHEVGFTVVAHDGSPARIVLLDARPGLPAEASFDERTGSFSWTPPGLVADRYTLTFGATLRDGTSCPGPVTVTVDPASEAADLDMDGVADDQDNCPTDPNRDQADGDHDGAGDACDGPLRIAAPEGATREPRALPDQDADGVPDEADLCPAAPDRHQADMDLDRQGDACDPDADGDGITQVPGEFDDNCPLAPNADQADADRDGVGDACDATAPGGRAPLAQQASGPPTSSAQAPAVGTVAVLGLLGLAVLGRRRA